MVILQIGGGIYLALKILKYVYIGAIGIAAAHAVVEFVVEDVYPDVKDWLGPDGIHILVLGRPYSGKSMFFRSLQGKYCQESDTQTNGEETIESFKATFDGKTYKFAKTSDLAGNRIFHETCDNKPSKVEELLPFADRIFFICNIQELLSNVFDVNIQSTPQEDIIERLGQISRLKKDTSSLDIIFSYINSVDQNELKQAEEFLKSQLTADRYKNVNFHEVDFLNEASTKKLLTNLF